MLSFDILWHSRRCPRRLRTWLSAGAALNPRLAGWDTLQRHARTLMDGPDERDSLDDIDAGFQGLQDAAVKDLAGSLMPQLVPVSGTSLWEEEGETLRELGWLGAVAAAPRGPVINADTWVQVFGRLPGLSRPVLRYRNLLARPDFLLHLGGNEWLAVFVRSSAKVKDALVSEAEFTRYVAGLAGVPIVHSWLLHTAEDYVRSAAEQDQVTPERFFSLTPLNALIRHLPHPLSADLGRLLDRAIRNEPCRGADCPYCRTAQPHLSEDSIFTLHRPGRVVQLLEQEGILELANLDKASADVRKELKERHLVQLRAFREQAVQVDRPALADFLNQLAFPLAFLDFESTTEAIPPVTGARPWEHLPFMYSLHVLDGSGGLAGLARSPDPESGLAAHVGMVDLTLEPLAALEAFARDLVDRVPPKGSIVAYGAAFETATLRRIGRLCPELGDAMESLAGRVVDLQVPFMNFWYYHPLQRGKLGLKKILPLLTSQSHEDLEFKSGGEAHLVYWFWRNQVRGGAPDAFPGLVAGQALADPMAGLASYCRMDTLGLVHVLQSLAQAAGI